MISTSPSTSAHACTLLVKLIAAYEFDEAEAEELLALRDVGSGRAWWNAYTGIFGDGILRFFGYEHGAESIRTYDGGLVPGLLQSEDYIRATIRGAGPNIRLAGRRVSPVPNQTVRTCRLPYPGETRQADPGTGPVEHGLRRNMSGSALLL